MRAPCAKLSHLMRGAARIGPSRRSGSSERRAANTVPLGCAWAARSANARAGAGRYPHKYIARLDGGAAAALASLWRTPPSH